MVNLGRINQACSVGHFLCSSGHHPAREDTRLSGWSGCIYLICSCEVGALSLTKTKLEVLTSCESQQGLLNSYLLSLSLACWKHLKWVDNQGGTFITGCSIRKPSPDLVCYSETHTSSLCGSRVQTS